MSDNKKLLSENAIRRFMTLANVGSLSDNFIQENATDEEINEVEEEVNESEEEIEEIRVGGNASQDADKEKKKLKETEEDLEEGGMYYARDDEEAADEDLPGDELDMGDEEVADEGGMADISLTEEEARLLVDLGERLASAMGADDEPAMDEPEMDEPEMDEPEMDLGAEEEDDEMMQEELVQEVLKRVTKRIVAEKLKNK